MLGIKKLLKIWRRVVMNMESKVNKYKYDIAVSYESHCREIVKRVVAYLKSDNYRVFFDVDRKSELLSENLEGKLYQVYQNESLIKVLFVTDKYLENQYTLLEARRSFMSVEDNQRRLIIVNFMGKDLPEPYSTYVYLDGDLSADDIAYRIGERVKDLRGECSTDLKVADKSPDANVYIKNINKVENNNGIITGDNAHMDNVSIHK